MCKKVKERRLLLKLVNIRMWIGVFVKSYNIRSSYVWELFINETVHNYGK